MHTKIIISYIYTYRCIYNFIFLKDELFQGMRRFVILKNLKVNTVNCENGGEYDDSVMNVKYIPLKRYLIFLLNYT